MLEGLKPVNREFSCKVRTILSQLDEADQKHLQAYLDDETTWPSNALAKALKTRDVHVSPNTIQKHRFGNCSC